MSSVPCLTYCDGVQAAGVVLSGKGNEVGGLGRASLGSAALQQEGGVSILGLDQQEVPQPIEGVIGMIQGGDVWVPKHPGWKKEIPHWHGRRGKGLRYDDTPRQGICPDRLKPGRCSWLIESTLEALLHFCAPTASMSAHYLLLPHSRPLPNARSKAPFAVGRRAEPSPSSLVATTLPLVQKLVLPWSRPREAIPPQILCLDPTPEWAPAASPGLGGWYPAQLMRGHLCWYRAHKEGWSFH